MEARAEFRLRVDEMRMAISAALDEHGAEVKAAVDRAVAAFDFEACVRQAVQKELARAVGEAVRYQAGEAVRPLVQKALDDIIAKGPKP